MGGFTGLEKKIQKVIRKMALWGVIAIGVLWFISDLMREVSDKPQTERMVQKKDREEDILHKQLTEDYASWYSDHSNRLKGAVSEFDRTMIAYDDNRDSVSFQAFVAAWENLQDISVEGINQESPSPSSDYYSIHQEYQDDVCGRILNSISYEQPRIITGEEWLGMAVALQRENDLRKQVDEVGN